MSIGPSKRINIASARAAGLRYVSAGEPGITRVRRAGGFVYRDSKGRQVRHKPILDRIRSLVIPPAWNDVWICASDDGHLQAVGRDARGRKQYRYHPEWRVVRDHGKYGSMVEFGQALPAIRRRVRADLRKPPLSREFVLATVVRLLERTLIRIGNKEYAKANNSFGLTTLLDHHVQVKGASLRFRFRAKSGVVQDIELTDSTLAPAVKKCRDLPGRALFQYKVEGGSPQCIDSADVNAYLREITGTPFTAKNFRTWAATVLAASAFCGCEAPASDSAFKRTVVPVIDSVAAQLGNTRAVCRKSYIHPAVFEAFRDGVTIAGAKTVVPGGQEYFPGESAVLELLKRFARESPRRAAA